MEMEISRDEKCGAKKNTIREKHKIKLMQGTKRGTAHQKLKGVSASPSSEKKQNAL